MSLKYPDQNRQTPAFKIISIFLASNRTKEGGQDLKIKDDGAATTIYPYRSNHNVTITKQGDLTVIKK